MERYLKRGFFDRHKCKNVVEYGGIFLEEIKALLPYFIKFKEDNTILPKEYPDNYAIGDSN